MTSKILGSFELMFRYGDSCHCTVNLLVLAACLGLTLQVDEKVDLADKGMTLGRALFRVVHDDTISSVSWA